jgi:hypothetical protein
VRIRVKWRTKPPFILLLVVLEWSAFVCNVFTRCRFVSLPHCLNIVLTMHCSKVFVRRYPLVYRQHLCNIQRSHCVCRTIELLTMAPTDIYLPFGFLQHLLHPTLHSTLHWSSAASSSSRLYIYTQTVAPSALSGERAIIPALHKSYTYIYQGSPTEPPVLSRELYRRFTSSTIHQGSTTASPTLYRERTTVLAS